MGGNGVLFRRFAALFPLFFLLAGCKTPSVKMYSPGREAWPLKDINQALDSNRAFFMGLKGVTGVYIGAKENGAPCIRVMVEKRDTDLEKKIPSTLEGFSVEIEETGRIEPMGNE